MKRSTNRLSLLAAGVACASLVACGPPGDKDEESVAVDHATTRKAVSDNTSHLAERLSKTIAFLDDSELWAAGVDAGFSSGGTSCAPAPVDPQTGEPTGEPQCEEMPAEEIDLDVTDESAEMTAWLEDHVFVDANVESEEELAVTYLIDGATLCAEDGGAADPECISQVDEAEIRLVATSPNSGDIDLDVLVGPNRANPVSFQLHEDLLAVEGDLGDAKESAEHIASITGDDLELPATMQGRVRAELNVDSDTKLTAALSVLAPIKVADGDYSFAMAAALPALSVSVDSQAKTIETINDIGAVDGSLPVTDYEYDPETDTETETTYQAGFHLGGMTSTALFEATKDLITVTGLGLGDSTSTFTVDGDEVLAVDLNADDGRALDVTVAADANGSVDVEVSPKLDLAVALKFAAAGDKLGDIADWMMDDVLRVTFDGATAPKVRIDEDGAEILDGTLTLSLDNAGDSVSAGAGQCLLATGDEIVVDDGTTMEPDPVEPAPQTNPIEELEAGACQ